MAPLSDIPAWPTVGYQVLEATTKLAHENEVLRESVVQLQIAMATQSVQMGEIGKKLEKFSRKVDDQRDKITRVVTIAALSVPVLTGLALIVSKRVIE